MPSIADWAAGGPVLGFTFACWLRLDPVYTTATVTPSQQQQQRRQLYSLYTGSGAGGLEAFVLPNGCLAVATVAKKEFLVTKVEEPLLTDGRWHFVAICQVKKTRRHSVQFVR